MYFVVRYDPKSGEWVAVEDCATVEAARDVVARLARQEIVAEWFGW